MRIVRSGCLLGLSLIGGLALVPGRLDAAPLGGGSTLQRFKDKVTLLRTGEKTWDTHGLILPGEKPFAVVGRDHAGDYNYRDVRGVHYDADRQAWSLRFRDGSRRTVKNLVIRLADGSERPIAPGSPAGLTGALENLGIQSKVVTHKEVLAFRAAPRADPEALREWSSPEGLAERLALKARQEAAQQQAALRAEKERLAAPVVRAKGKIAAVGAAVDKLRALVAQAQAGELDGHALSLANDPRVTIADAEGSLAGVSGARASLPTELQMDLGSAEAQLPVLKEQALAAHAALAAVKPMSRARADRLRQAFAQKTNGWSLHTSGAGGRVGITADDGFEAVRNGKPVTCARYREETERKWEEGYWDMNQMGISTWVKPQWDVRTRRVLLEQKELKTLRDLTDWLGASKG
jgi:hypothetical protein